MAARSKRRPAMPACPKCGQNKDLRHIEDCVVERRVTGVDETGVLGVDGFYITEGWDEASDNPRLYCPECDTQFAIPKGMEVEFV